MMKVCVLQVFFLFSSTKIGHDRPSVKDRYAISDKNILRSYRRAVFLSEIPCLPFVHALGDVQEKRKKMGWAVRGGGFSPDETFASTLSELQQFVRKNPLSTFLLYSA
ncbi:hypothetical protein F3F50_06465 [Bacteroides ovatus]|uniref:Uncharacterized protein n=2 Tax=Bacteroides ovatus TaxID=28116 RepID=A0A395W317_BACOV|nr:hypothetical protein F3F50_06465 [Bacteroides ovatus]RGS87516.1 hypothetical protein DWX70_03435 [Bacteroides ovatus]